MNGLQVFALVVLPIMVAALGWIMALAFAPRPRSSEAEAHPSSGSPQHRI